MTQRANSTDIQGLEDIETPFGSFLAGKYKRSFAYATIKDRLPIILTQVIDTISRYREDIIEKYGEEACEGTKCVIRSTSKLKNELVTNKPILPLIAVPNYVQDDSDVWNNYLEKQTEIEHESPSWFYSKWLYVECYMYRRIAQEFLLTKSLKFYDPFEIQKQESYHAAVDSISYVTKHILQLLKADNLSATEQRKNFIDLMKLDLWGNRSDLSLSAGTVSEKIGNPLHVLEALDKELIVDHSQFVWELINDNSRDQSETFIIDVVLDNAGYELFTDLCLAAYIISKKLASQVRFYVKKYPWYISDVTVRDFNWLISALVDSENEYLKGFGHICKKYLSNGDWTIEEESFWTEPYDFSEMKSECPRLYSKLSEAQLVIFKGDLNYRKLLGDINWEYTTEFLTALRGFLPTNIVSLRTLKSDLCAGLPVGLAEKLKSEDPKWLLTGRLGIIQAAVKTMCNC